MSERPESGDDLQPEIVAAAITARRSINLFEPEPVGAEVLLAAIDAARWAPNHRLTEPWRFYVIGERTKMALAQATADLDTQSKGEKVGAARLKRMLAVPAYFVVTSPRSDDVLREREDYAATCCAVQNVMLYLWQCGVGVKWTTGDITRDQRFYDILQIDPNTETVVGFFWYGRAQIVPEQKRKPLAEIVILRE